MAKTLVFTGGHHTSALEVAKQLKKRGWNIIWFGHRHSMWGDTHDSAEYKEVVAEGIAFFDLKAGKFHKTFNPVKLIRIPWGFLQAFWWLMQIRPKGIVSFGGYLAVPTVIAGWLLGVPSVTHEQTVVKGWANSLISHFTKKIGLTWESSKSLYPFEKSVVVGLPMRTELVDLANKKQIRHTKPIVYITGGKQGSHPINQAIFASLPQLLEKYTLIHQTGSSSTLGDYDKAKDLASSDYEVFDFGGKRAIEALAMADIVVGRAGAHTIYELGLLGKKAVLIPIPWVSHHEQDKNAEVLARAGNAVILPESKLNPDALLSALEEASKLAAKPLPFPLHATNAMVRLIEDTLA